MFKTNVGNTDRVIRIVLGIALVAAYFLYPASWGWLYLVGAVIAFATAAMSSCPIYSMLGMNTCPMKK